MRNEYATLCAMQPPTLKIFLQVASSSNRQKIADRVAADDNFWSEWFNSGNGQLLLPARDFTALLIAAVMKPGKILSQQQAN